MQTGQQMPLPFIATLVVFFFVWYFLLIRPQRSQAKKRQEMLNTLKRGDRVVTMGGIHATVADLKEDVLVLDLAPNIRVKADRGSISYVRAKGEGKAEE
jgi:preprotein translocase subunit YajC